MVTAAARPGIRTSVALPTVSLATRMLLTDLLALVFVVFGTQFIWLGTDASVANSGTVEHESLEYTVVSLVLVGSWLLALQLFDARAARVLGSGAREYRAIIDASLRLFGLVAIIAFLFKLDIARGYILLAFPVGVIVLVASRWVWRRWLAVQRRRGAYCTNVLLIGSPDTVSTVARELDRVPESGYRIVGACVDRTSAFDLLGRSEAPVFTGVHDVLERMREVGADTVVVTSTDALSADGVRRLSWGLEPGAEHLVVVPSLIDVGGPRIHTRPVAGLPLIHVETPQYEGRKLVAKQCFDFVVAGLLVTLLAPVFAVVALAVKASSPGPVFYNQERVGRNGELFRMRKFRTMSVGADTQVHELRTGQDAGNAVLFKMKSDPRVTPVGRGLRRFSLDELPQLLNVLRGEMSLVGPRPSLPSEAAVYEDHVHRRFLVKPGLTGLWQISGRSSLDWENSVRLDLYYVENWSLTGDIVILAKTARAVFDGRGAY
ncbi:sugar transferase [Agromyces seonyuensis]|uniref:Exopolysaccharide biosynthesis polyprenyl glycosylphosphotransferase n=1 Tax=Agromyces seonyuensis TaxID=2662446 RepID=A0A6I4P3S0_9MICO|nr:sugar transferase [Agromyces seonyuensis]MWB99515.1 exopolysaccharide biosynthesis polyprenyl glycosylphosphotransferase [Agromyces seonyuensis]